MQWINGFKGLFLMAFFGVALSAQAVVQLDKDYAVLPQPQPTETGKIEVLELFWYGCPHCYALEPKITAWAKKLPKDVQFRRMPVPLNPSWAMTKVYYTLEALGELDRLHAQVFDAIHAENVILTNQETLFDWMQQHGIDRKKFVDTYNSFAVQSKLKRAEQLARAYRVQGVPSIVVDGKYLVLNSAAKSLDDLLRITDEVIGVARKAHAT